MMTTQPTLGSFMRKAPLSQVSLTQGPVIQVFSGFATWLPTGCLLITIEQEAQETEDLRLENIRVPLVPCLVEGCPRVRFAPS